MRKRFLLTVLVVLSALGSEAAGQVGTGVQECVVLGQEIRDILSNLSLHMVGSIPSGTVAPKAVKCLLGPFSNEFESTVDLAKGEDCTRAKYDEACLKAMREARKECQEICKRYPKELDGEEITNECPKAVATHRFAEKKFDPKIHCKEEVRETEVEEKGKKRKVKTKVAVAACTVVSECTCDP